MNIPSDEAIKVRVPAGIKARLQIIANLKLCTISDVAREALLEYLAAHGAKEKSSSSKSHFSPAGEDPAAGKKTRAA